MSKAEHKKKVKELDDRIDFIISDLKDSKGYFSEMDKKPDPKINRNMWGEYAVLKIPIEDFNSGVYPAALIIPSNLLSFGNLLGLQGKKVVGFTRADPPNNSLARFLIRYDGREMKTEEKRIGDMLVSGEDLDNNDNFKTMERRHKVAEDYCKEKGWDINNLTLEQTLEIRKQKEWK